MTRIVWTEQARADLAPRAVPAGDEDVDVDVVWQKTRESFAAVREMYEKGLEQPGAAREAMRGMLDVLAREALPKDASTVALGGALRAMEQFVQGRVGALVLAIAKRCGPAAALDATIEAHAFGVKTRHPAQWFVNDPGAAFAVDALRLALLRHGEEAALERARARWASLPIDVKVTLAHALSSAPDLAADAAREIAALPEKTRLIVAPVLASLRDPTHLEGMLAHRMGAWPLVDAVENLGEAALPALLAMWKRPVHDRLHLARATACFDDKRIAMIFAGELGKKTTREIARDWFLRFPAHAHAALAELAETRSAVAAIAADVLAQARRSTTEHEEAPLVDLPMVLADPPWMRKKPKRTLVTVQLDPRERPETLTIAPAFRAYIIAYTAFENLPPLDAQATEAWAAQVRAGNAGVAWRAGKARVPKDAVLALLKTHGLSVREGGYFPFQTLAVFGDEVLPVFTKFAEKHWETLAPYISDFSPSGFGPVMLGIDSHRLAAAMLDSLEEPRWRRAVWRWYEAHPEATIAGVLPIAVGARGRARTAAERVLRKLARRWADAIRAEGRERGAEAAVEEILAFDERWECPQRAPKMPASWKPDTFTRPLLRDGRALPLEAVQRLGHMLAFTTPHAPYVGIEDVKRVCEPRSLAELAWDTARAWETSSARNADAWMLESIAWLGDDEVIRRTTPAIKHPHIVTVLGYAATDAAAMELCTIARRIEQSKDGSFRTRHWGDRADVELAFADLARRRGMTVEDLEDSLTPAHAEARVTLDYGSRKLEVGFDERLDPYIAGPKGRLRDLPKVAKNDDAEKVSRAQTIWAELQEDVAAIADVRLGSLERAMIGGRTWSPSNFRHAWMEHPLMRHLSRGVVWRAAETTFRIAEDGSFADVNDAAFETSDEIGVAHVADMGDDERAAWKRVFLDYRIAQPIEQLGRPVIAAKGASLVLVPPTTLPVSELIERIRAKGFVLAWRDREQVASRACVRTPHRLAVVLGVDQKHVVRATVTVEGGTLDQLHSVDVSEAVHDFGFVVV
jgi:hypothetical protein